MKFLKCFNMRKYITLVLITLFSISSCKIFREKSSDYKFEQNKDSLGVINTAINLSKLFVLTGNNELLEIDANGYSKVRVGSDGSVLAEGDQENKGNLSVKRSKNSQALVNKSDSFATLDQLSNVNDSTAVESKAEYTYNAKPDAWFNTWWVWIVGVVLVVSNYFIIKKFDIIRFLK